MKTLKRSDFRAIRKYETVKDYASHLSLRHPESLNADESIDVMVLQRFAHRYGPIDLSS